MDAVVKKLLELRWSANKRLENRVKYECATCHFHGKHSLGRPVNYKKLKDGLVFKMVCEFCGSVWDYYLLSGWSVKRESKKLIKEVEGFKRERKNFLKWLSK